MEITFETQLNPELDCVLLLSGYFAEQSDARPVARKLADIAAERGLPREELEALAAPILKLESHILSNLTVPEKRLRFYFPAQADCAGTQGSEIGEAFWTLYYEGVRFRDLSPADRYREKMRLIDMILTPMLKNSLPEVPDLSALLGLLDSLDCKDHIARVCMSIFRDPVSHQEEFERIIREAAVLYRQQMHLLPTVSDEWVAFLKSKMRIEAEKQYIMNFSFPLTTKIIFRPSAFEVYHMRVYDMTRPDQAFLAVAGVLDDQVLALINRYDCSTPQLVQRLKTVADMRRMEIIAALQAGPLYVEDLTERLSMSPALISHHISYLLHDQLIKLEKDGAKNRYSLNYTQITLLLQNFQRFLRG